MRSFLFEKENIQLHVRLYVNFWLKTIYPNCVPQNFSECHEYFSDFRHVENRKLLSAKLIWRTTVFPNYIYRTLGWLFWIIYQDVEHFGNPLAQILRLLHAGWRAAQWFQIIHIPNYEKLKCRILLRHCVQFELWTGLWVLNLCSCGVATLLSKYDSP